MTGLPVGDRVGPYVEFEPMKISVNDILAELGVREMTDPEQIRHIPIGKIESAVERIRARAKAAEGLRLADR
ncbi:hypothetical protein AMJ57_05035 [Parcubacteria bacterium SG8_24]|nr:MAG: hypothetical protein AMJ57_05035 [Parcubacteria bacterium SG8_24]